MDESVRALAAQQHGLVTRTQLIGLGMRADSIQWQVRSGRLICHHRGVYRIGPLTVARAQEMSAVLACGPAAVVSHHSAAALWQLPGAHGSRIAVQISVVGAHRGRRPGVRTHRVRRLPPDEITKLDGVPLTTPARTILDLAGEADAADLERMVADACKRGIATVAQLRRLIARYPNRRGVARLRGILDAGSGPAFIRSEAEMRFLDLARTARLPLPKVNVLIAGLEVDFFWPPYRLVVEVDGFAFHSSRFSFERDRRRDATLIAHGFRVMRVTWRQIVEEPLALVVSLTRALSAGEEGRPP
jgi:very-short-patch-repair endonuclease